MHIYSLYMGANHHDFKDDDAKIYFLLFMTEGLAEKWAENPADEKGDNFGSWFSFQAYLQVSFEDRNKHHQAQARLEGLKQGTQMAEEFFQSFEINQHTAGYDEISHYNYLTVLLEQNVKSSLIDWVFNLDSLPATYAAWKNKILVVDDLDHCRNEARTATRVEYMWQGAKPQQQNSSGLAYRQLQQTTSTDWQSGSGTTFRGQGKPMDIDAA